MTSHPIAILSLAALAILNAWTLKGLIRSTEEKLALRPPPLSHYSEHCSSVATCPTNSDSLITSLDRRGHPGATHIARRASTCPHPLRRQRPLRVPPSLAVQRVRPSRRQQRAVPRAPRVALHRRVPSGRRDHPRGPSGRRARGGRRAGAPDALPAAHAPRARG